MTTRTSGSWRVRVALAVAALVAAGAAYRVGHPAGENGCTRLVSYTANWTGSARASYVEWGPVGEQRRAESVAKPWQEINQPVECGKVVALHIEFGQPVSDLLCAVTANNTVHQPPAQRSYRCFEQVLVY